MIPKYTFDEIKFSVDQKTLERALGLYDSKKIVDFKATPRGYFATVKGTSPYRVFVSTNDIYSGDCDCYVSQKGDLCKHMVALAIHAIYQGKKIDNKVVEESTIFSGKMGELSKDELVEIKKEISSAMKFIKAYSGSSKAWFQYTYSLYEGSRKLAYIFSKLPVSKQTADLIIKTLLKLDKKLCSGGVDDSDGAVGGLIYETVEILKEFAKLDKKCLKSFETFQKQETCFGWEKDLVEILDKN